MPYFGAWLGEIRRLEPEAVYAFCSESRGASDPPSKPVACKRYRFIEEEAWRPLPAVVSIPHPFRPNATEASAFVVQRIIDAGDAGDAPRIEWFSLTSGPWRRHSVPTRGEYLIRPGRGEPMRKWRAVLVLRDPYLAVVSSAAS
jgi:hypothetical protein